jgi:hypothetical protein
MCHLLSSLDSGLRVRLSSKDESSTHITKMGPLYYNIRHLIRQQMPPTRCTYEEGSNEGRPPCIRMGLLSWGETPQTLRVSLRSGLRMQERKLKQRRNNLALEQPHKEHTNSKARTCTARAESKRTSAVRTGHLCPTQHHTQIGGIKGSSSVRPSRERTETTMAQAPTPRVIFVRHGYAIS